MRSILSVLTILAFSALANAQTAADHTFERAGYSNTVSRWARPSQTPKHSLGYVGRATVYDHDSAPRESEGVIGYDYVGYGPTIRVFPGWVNPNASPGSYATDGPRIFDVFSIRPLRRALNKAKPSEE